MKNTLNQLIGDLGESFGQMFLVKHNHNIIATNYRKSWGEIDIVSEKSNIIHFIEVKTSSVNREKDLMSKCIKYAFLGKASNIVTRATFNILYFNWKIDVTHETQDYENYIPEERVHTWKKKRIAKTIESYLTENKISENKEWVIDIISVYLDFSRKAAIIRFTEEVSFD